MSSSLPRLVRGRVHRPLRRISEPAIDPGPCQPGKAGVVPEERGRQSVLNQRLGKTREHQSGSVVEPVEHPLQRWSDMSLAP
jgi:hypothetical protein